MPQPNVTPIEVKDIPMPSKGPGKWEAVINSLFAQDELHGLKILIDEGKSPEGTRITISKTAKAMRKNITITVDDKHVYLQRAKTKYPKRTRNPKPSPGETPATT